MKTGTVLNTLLKFTMFQPINIKASNEVYYHKILHFKSPLYISSTKKCIKKQRKINLYMANMDIPKQNTASIIHNSLLVTTIRCFTNNTHNL